MRKGFSLLTAIFVMVLLSTVGALISSLAGKTVKETTFQYRKEQAILLAKSYTELAIMAATANDAQAAGTDCIEGISGDVGNDPSIGEGYRIQADISYIGANLVCTDVNGIAGIDGTVERDDNIPLTSLYALIDITVSYRDFDAVDSATIATNLPWITYHRRTLQRL
jgi:type II secretory pathway pseudopilin PulG